MERHRTGVITPGNGSTAPAPARVTCPDWTSVFPVETTEALLGDSLEKENAWVKKLLADLSLDNQILKEVSSGNF